MSANTQYNLQFTVENQPAGSLKLEDGVFIVGSAPDSQVHLQTETISRQHLRITVRGERVSITDLASRNGTFLNGQQLQPHQEVEWRPGDTLKLPGAAFNLTRLAFSPVASDAQQPLRLSIAPEAVSVNQPIQLTVTAVDKPQQVSLQGQATVAGLEVQLFPTGGEARPGAPFTAEARLQKRQAFWLGGIHRVRFAALAVSGAFDTREVTVRLRPRFEVLLFIPLLLVAGLAAILFLQQSPPPVPTPTVPATFIPSITPSPNATVTPPPEPTWTPLPITCVPKCAALGWPSYTVVAGDTLASIAQASGASVSRLTEVNCIPNPDLISTGQQVCVPRLPTTDLLIQNQVTGTTDVGSPWPIMAEFTISVSNISGNTAFGRVRVSSTSSGILIGAARGAGWNCTVSNMNAIDCTHPGPLQPGDTLPIIVVAADYARDLTVRVQVIGDTNTGNNSATAQACLGGRCDAQDYWRQLCQADRDAELKLTPPAPGPLGGCARWQALGL